MIDCQPQANEGDRWSEIRPRRRAPLVLVERHALTTDPTALLIFPVVRYPEWMYSFNRSQGPAAKTALWYSSKRGFGFGQVTDLDGWCASGRWDDLLGAVETRCDVRLNAIQNRRVWDVDAFKSDPAFRHFALEAGLRDPWPELEWAIGLVLGRLNAAEPMRTGTNCTVGMARYLTGSTVPDVHRNRRQAIDVLPHLSLRQKLCSDDHTLGIGDLLSAIDHGRDLVVPLAAWLSCSRAFARHLMAQRMNLERVANLETFDEFKRRVVSLQHLPQPFWPRTDESWAVVAMNERLAALFRAAGRRGPALALQVLARVLGGSPTADLTRRRVEARARLIALVEACPAPKDWALEQVATLSNGRVDALLHKADHAARMPLLGIPRWVRQPLPQCIRTLARLMSETRVPYQLEGLTSLSRMTCWGKRVRNCLAIPSNSGRYIANGRLVLALTSGGRPIATVAVAPELVDERTELVVTELKEHELPMSPVAVLLLEGALERARSHFKGIALSAWRQEMSAWRDASDTTWLLPPMGVAGARKVIEAWLDAMTRDADLPSDTGGGRRVEKPGPLPSPGEVRA